MASGTYDSIRRVIRLAALAAVFVLRASSVEANWAPNGIPIGGAQARVQGRSVIPDGSGGWYIAWADEQTLNSTRQDMRLQHLAPSGAPVPGWPLAGIVVSGGPRSEFYPGVALDGQGGVLVSWQDGRNTSWDVYVQRYSSDGVVSPGWAPGGVRATSDPHQQQEPRIASDALGGAFLVWSDDRTSSVDGRERCYGQHITAWGVIASGWPTDGREISSEDTSDQRIIADGQSGCYFVWTDYRRGGGLPSGFDVYGQHLLPDGSIAPGWQVDGNLIFQGRGALHLLPDAVGGLYAASSEFTVQSGTVPARYWLARFDPNGVPAAGWTLGGVPLQSTLTSRSDLHCSADSLGGVFASWDDGNSQGGDIYATRALPDGTTAAGWGPNGIAVSDPASPQEYTSDVGPDGMGGAYFAWEKHFNGYAHAYVQHLGPYGAIALGWPLGGVPASAGTSTVPQVGPSISPDGFGNALVYWFELPLMAQFFVTNGIVATSLSLASTDIRSDRVTLIWQGTGAGQITAHVDRRTENEDWQRIGSPDRDADDRLRFVDDGVAAGIRYAYRLGYPEAGGEQFTKETWIDVPSADVFALEGLRPNPAVGALNVSFSLPMEGSATMELLDLAGRRVIDREVGQLGRGRHVLRLDASGHTAPGVYWVRLRQGAQQALTRAVVMR